MLSRLCKLQWIILGQQFVGAATPPDNHVVRVWRASSTAPGVHKRPRGLALVLLYLIVALYQVLNEVDNMESRMPSGLSCNFVNTSVRLVDNPYSVL